MGLTISTISSSGYTAQVRCDECPAEAPKAEHTSREKAKQRAERAAEDHHFTYDNRSKLWHCGACRFRRLPDNLKAILPNLCAKYGVPLPGAETPTPEPQQKKGRKKRSGDAAS